jgi:ferric-dicitrate binding protein FerR (iron transport regulator)
MTSDKNNQTDVERLLALAGPRDDVPAERLERMRAAVHDAWTAQTKPRATPRWLWTLMTAAAAAAIVLMVVRTPPDAGTAKRAEAPAVAAVHIRTGPAERRSLLLPGGGELRVDASSVVTIAENGEIHISTGALYLDSKGTTLPTVITPAGRITNVGTRFEVRLVPGGGAAGGENARGAAADKVATRVRVRDGKVRLAQASTVSEVAGAEELLARADLSTSRRHVDPFGAEWAWVARAAPRFELEGRSLGSFLDWIETEGAWTVAFASPALERRARSTVLHGSIERMSTTEALEAILPACGLVHRVDLKTGRVTVAAEGPGGQ